MTLQNHFKYISEFLSNHFELHSKEALEWDFEQLNPEYRAWVEYLHSLSDIERLTFENSLEVNENAPKTLIEFTQDIKYIMSLIELRNISTPLISKKDFNQHALRKLTPKKWHETQAINSQISELHFSKIIDIGGGAGHLCTLLLLSPNLDNISNVLCIDADKNFQNIGQKKIEKYFQDISNKMTYQCSFVDKTFKRVSSKDELLIGLHACGELTNYIIHEFNQGEYGHLLSYGCCYHKLDSNNIEQSHYGKKNKCLLTNHSLGMSAKSFKTLTKDDVEQRIRIKSYRYTIHKLMNKKFKSLGSPKKSLYKESFDKYVAQVEPSLLNHYTQEELNEFYLSQKNTEENNLIFSADILRQTLARVIEYYIVLDRALSLEEVGHHVQIEQSFNRTLSPRNLSIRASRK